MVSRQLNNCPKGPRELGNPTSQAQQEQRNKTVVEFELAKVLSSDLVTHLVTGFYIWGALSIGYGVLTKRSVRWGAVSMGTAFVSFGTLFTFAI